MWLDLCDAMVAIEAFSKSYQDHLLLAPVRQSLVFCDSAFIHRMHGIRGSRRLPTPDQRFDSGNTSMIL